MRDGDGRRRERACRTELAGQVTRCQTGRLRGRSGQKRAAAGE